MLLDRWNEAWQVSDEIDARRAFLDPPPEMGQQRFWDGRSLTGRRVMLRCLHGFGDALQFLRYAPLLCEQSASLCVEANPEIAPLLQACDGVDQVITWGLDAPAIEPSWEAQVEIMELPRLFRAEPDTVPARFPYLQVSRLAMTEATRELSSTMEQKRADGALQIGLSWRSSNWNPLRSIPLMELSDALDGLESCAFYSIQQHGGAELAAVAIAARFRNIETDLVDLAVRLSMLDCVVTIDGVVAHLAGSLGLPVLLLLPFAADWRWGLADRTPWYPKMQLFRQLQPGNWAAPLQGMRAALQHLTKR